VHVYRDDEAARAAYVAALERKAARVVALEDRIRELEAENRALRAAEPREPRAARLRESAPDPSGAEIYVDGKVESYVAALINATDPRRTDGILSGALGSDAASVLDAARLQARAAARRYVIPTDVRVAALEILPGRIMMIDPDVDPRGIVRAILDVVEVP
jgi:MoxR-like ATPase